MDQRKRILIVDDDPKFVELMRVALERADFSVVTATNGLQGEKTFRANPVDLVILDVMMPQRDGFEMLRDLRAISAVPIIMLTALGDTENVVKGLELGADDYITKPFSFAELVARLKAVIRRTASHGSAILECEDLVLDGTTHEVKRAGVRLHLTRTEFLLLQKLMQNTGQVVSRQILIESVWGDDRDIESNTLDAFVRLLRQKVDGAGQVRLIQTVRGFGYTIRPSGREGRTAEDENA